MKEKRIVVGLILCILSFMLLMCGFAKPEEAVVDDTALMIETLKDEGCVQEGDFWTWRVADVTEDEHPYSASFWFDAVDNYGEMTIYEWANEDGAMRLISEEHGSCVWDPEIEYFNWIAYVHNTF